MPINEGQADGLSDGNQSQKAEARAPTDTTPKKRVVGDSHHQPKHHKSLCATARASSLDGVGNPDEASVLARHVTLDEKKVSTRIDLNVQMDTDGATTGNND